MANVYPKPDLSGSEGNQNSAKCYVSKKVGVILSVFFVSAIASAALLAVFLSPSSQKTDHFEHGYNVDGTMIVEVLGSRADDIRLPASIKPVNYVIRLQPFINGDFTFNGYTEITIEVMEATSSITLHTVDITTENDTIKVNPSDDLTGPGVAVTGVSYDADPDFLTIQLEDELVAGQQYVLAMNFVGFLNDALAGFYRSQYMNEEGEVTWLAATQFEPTDARRAFPCFDEPAMKATFEIFIARQTNMTAISNMPKIETVPFDDDPEWVWDHFNQSLPMSTYLVAFVVSDFENLNSTANDHVLFRAWARKGAVDQVDYARGAAPAILTWYEEYFNVPFPLPKQDMIALPDFSAGAMENWGLITYREDALLYDPILSSEHNKERVAVVIAHELAHQWFGDLVTLKWWTDLWLNEGFATYVEYLGTDSYEPTWEFLDRIITDEQQVAFRLDCLESSHPISVPVERPEEINQLFDTISYSKGGSILRMVNNSLTEDTFRSGLTNYLNIHKYDNAEQDDLWSALTDQAHADGNLPSDLTVKTIMDTWTLQMGYPVVNVVLNGDGTASLTQERFLLVNNPNSNDTHDYKWWVPITFATQENPDFSQTKAVDWIPATETFSINGMPDSGSWVMFNLQQTGYYRVNYESSNWQLLVEQLRDDHTIIVHTSRSQLIDDAMNLAKAGQLSYEIALDLNSYLNNELQYVPWYSALSSLGYLENMFTRTGGYGSLRTYVLDLLTPLYNSVGFEDIPEDGHLVHFKRTLALSWACSLGMDDCVQNSVALYSAWMDNPTDLTIVSSNLKSTVYCTGIAEGGEEEWNFAWEHYLSSDLASEKATILSALGCSKEVWILSRYLEMAFDSTSGIRKQDARSVYSSVATNDIGRDLAWDYLRDNVDLITTYLQTFTAIGDMVSVVSYEFNTNEELNELTLFVEQNSDQLGSASFALDQSIERTSNNIAWMDNYYDVIVVWLQDNGYGKMLKKKKLFETLTR